MITIVNNNIFLITKKNIPTKNLISHINSNYICISINTVLSDLNSVLLFNSSVFFVTTNDAKSLNVIRHSCAHLLAHAVKLLYKDAQFGIGPVIKNGFFYDFFTIEKITDESLKNIESKMKELSNQTIQIKKFELEKQEAMIFFKNDKYKSHILNTIRNDRVTCYSQKDFTDLCKGPHVATTAFLKHFKLLKISGAYWKNDPNNEMLYRIYGTAWQNEENLKQHLFYREKQLLHDHKKIGKQLGWFDFYDYAPGVVFWNKNGWTIYKTIISYMRSITKDDDYIEVNTPMMLDSSLFDRSGHLTKFNEYIFQYKQNNVTSVLKPMNCPCHATIFQHFYKKSYKDLPFRISEFGSCFRNELSGALHGLMRLKNFVQDDGHVFCTHQDINDEIVKFIHTLKRVYYTFGFKIFKVSLSKRPSNVTDHFDIWEKAESSLEKIIKKLNIKYTTTNEGAFYGPKLEFILKDNLDRLWQCGTIQVDFFTAKKLNVTYVDEYGKENTPVILHRAILGSIERFLGMLVENNCGSLPFWLMPVQIEIIYVSNIYLNYAKNIYNLLKNKYRTRLSINNERLDYKVKRCILEKIPYIIVVGEKESMNKFISVRYFNSNKVEYMTLNQFFVKLKFKI